MNAALPPALGRLPVVPECEELESCLALVGDRLRAPIALASIHGPQSADVELVASIGGLPAESAARIAQAAGQGLRFDRRRREEQSPGEAINEAAPPGVLDHHLLALRVQLDGAAILMVSALRPFAEPAFAEEDRQSAAELHRWLTQFLRLWWRNRAERSRASALAAALDLWDVGVLLLDRNADVVYSNEKATALSASGDGLRLLGDGITAIELEDAVRLHTAIQHAIYSNDPEAFPKESSRVAVLLLSRGKGRPLIVAVKSLGRRPVSPRDPVVLLYVLDPDVDTRQLVALTCELFNLTAAEAKLTQHLVSGLTVAEAAKRMGIQLQTARAYLKQVFAKTECCRQAGLVRTILTSMLPLTTRVRPTIL